jgi:uncharacterized protein YkwD
MGKSQLLYFLVASSIILFLIQGSLGFETTEYGMWIKSKIISEQYPEKWIAQAGTPVNLVRSLATPPNPTADIPWSSGYSGVADIQTAFNNARSTENTQLGISIPMLTMPTQFVWDTMSNSEKALWLINRERIDRSVHPLHGTEPNVRSVAQYYAQYLIDNNAFGHNEDGRTPWGRLSDNPAIGACQDYLGVAENLAVFRTSGTSIPLPVERAVYMWMYEDKAWAWGHRTALLYYPYNDNSGTLGKEGFLGIGRASGPHSGWPFAEMIVMNVFDPCATWTYAAEVDDLVCSWDGSGVWSRNSNTGVWSKIAPPSHLVAAGDLDGDGTDDLLWSKAGDGVWVKSSTTGTWSRICIPPAWDMASGDMNGDGRDDLVGIWSTGVYYKNTIGGTWVKMGPLGGLIAVGNLDGDGTDDLLWSNAGDGVWVKYSSTGTWSRLCVTPASDMASGDMNGDGRDDLVGIWGAGVYFKDTISGTWVKMGPVGDLIETGDLDEDGTDDLLWSNAGDGVWVKYSSTGTWSRLHPTAARHLDGGVLR